MSEVLFDILRKVTTATMTTMLLKKGHQALLDERAKAASLAKGERVIGELSRCALFPCGKTLRPRKAGQSDIDPRGDRGKCRRASSRLPTPWACRAPASLAIFFARG